MTQFFRLVQVINFQKVSFFYHFIQEIDRFFNGPLKRDCTKSPNRYEYLLLFSNSESHTHLDKAIRLGSFWHLDFTLFVQKLTSNLCMYGYFFCICISGNLLCTYIISSILSIILTMLHNSRWDDEV